MTVLRTAKNTSARSKDHAREFHAQLTTLSLNLPEDAELRNAQKDSRRILLELVIRSSVKKDIHTSTENV